MCNINENINIISNINDNIININNILVILIW